MSAPPGVPMESGLRPLSDADQEQWRRDHRAVTGKSLATMGEEVMAWAARKGWEPDPTRTFGDECALLHSEISEALEAFRDWGLADASQTVHAPLGTAAPVVKPEGVASEFADVLIRLVHYAHVHGFDLEAEFERKMAYNEGRPWRHGGRAL